MRAQRLVAARLILLCVGVKVAERSGQAVAAMLQRGSTERPQRVLQTLCQGHKALAAEHDMRMLPAREGQPEVIQPVLERHTIAIDGSKFKAVNNRDKNYTVAKVPGGW